MKTFCTILAVIVLSGASIAQSNVTGSIPQYAGGLVTATTGSTIANASINAQGNFTVPIPSNPTQHVMTFTPPNNTPYSPFNLTVTAGVGTTNITAQIQAVVPQIGINLGIANQASVGTDPNGYAIPGTGGPGGISAVVGTSPIAVNTVSGTATVSCPDCGSSSTDNVFTQPQQFQLGPRVGATAYVATGDSITAGTGVTNPANDYVSQIAGKVNVTATNIGISGAQSEDWVINQIFPQLNPTTSNNPIVTGNILSNDNHFCGSTTGCIANATSSVQSALSYASIPITNKIFGNATATTTGTWTADTSVIPGGVASSVTGSSKTYSFTTTATNQAVYLWYKGQDSNAGTASASFDSGAVTGTLTTAGTSGQCICTQNGGTATVWGIRFVIPTAGTHSLAITVTSGSGSVTYLGIGLASKMLNPVIGPPSIFFGSSIYELDFNLQAGTNAYFAAMSTLVTQMQNDDLLVAFGNINNYMDNATDMSGSNVTVPNGMGDNNSGTSCTGSTAAGQHPNICGMGHMADYYLSMIQPTPASTASSGGSVGPGVQTSAAVYDQSGTQSHVGPSSIVFFPDPSSAEGSIAVGQYDNFGEGIVFNPENTPDTSVRVPVVDQSAGNASGVFVDHSVSPATLGFFGSNGGSIVEVVSVARTAPAKSLAIDASGKATFINSITGVNVKTTVYTVATLPAATSLPAGTQVTVSDGLAITATNPCTGGGSTFQIAITNGTTWSCH